MIRSTNRELDEYALIRQPKHVAKVWAAIEAALPSYWDKFVESERKSDAMSELLAKHGKKAPPAKPGQTVIAPVFEKAIKEYEKEADRYRNFFDPAAMEEYRDDPNAFKQGLSRDVPVIANTLRQRNAELKEWQMHFRAARANDLLAVFSNVLDFREEWSESHPPDEYAGYDALEAFELDPLDNDEAMNMQNVIGMGIKSNVLYHLDPQRLPARGQRALYGLYFLSGRSPFGLPSDTSEFLMINDPAHTTDDSIIMDQNYWYPYGLFSLYALRVFRWIDAHMSAGNVTLDRTHRYVYVQRFFEAVCAQHAEDLKTMRNHERFEVPG